MQKYEQLKTLGEGGYGKAILARVRSDKSMVVIKEVRISALSAKDRQEAMKEAKVLASLRHPNIVSYIESFQERGCFYIVMEYADGGDLAQKIQKRGRTNYFTEEEVLHDFIQIALAIKYIHDRKILHRDLKAQNVFLTKDGNVKLGDFGIARVLENTFQLCRTQIGTPYYLSPEICEGKNYNSKTDIWSLGCILYELCSLKHAFEAANMNGLLMNIVRGKYSPIPSCFSQNLSALVSKMLTKESSQRPSINTVLTQPFIKERLTNYLDKAILQYEFNHTILHGRKPFAAPTVVLSHHSEEDEDSNTPPSPVPVPKKEFSPPKPAPQDPLPPPPKRQPEPRKKVEYNYPMDVDPRYARRNQQEQAPANVDPRYRPRPQANPDVVIQKNNNNGAQYEEDRRKQAAEDRRILEERKAREEENRKKAAIEERRRQEMEERKRKEIEERRRKVREDEEKRLKLEAAKKAADEDKRILNEQKRQEEERKRLQQEQQKKQALLDMRRAAAEKARQDEMNRIKEEREEKKRREELRRKREAEEEERRLRQIEEDDKKRKAYLAEQEKQRALDDMKRAAAEKARQDEINRKKELEEQKRKIAEERKESERRAAEQKKMREQEERKRYEEEIRRKKEAEQRRKEQEREEERKRAEEYENMRQAEKRAKQKEQAQLQRQQQEEERRIQQKREQERIERIRELEREKKEVEEAQKREMELDMQRKQARLQKEREMHEEQKRAEENKKKKQQQSPRFLPKPHVEFQVETKANQQQQRQAIRDSYVQQSAQEGPSWAQEPPKKIIPTFDEPQNDDQFAKIQSKDFFESVKKIRLMKEANEDDDKPPQKEKKREITEEERKAIYEEQRQAFKANKQKLKNIEYGSEVDNQNDIQPKVDNGIAKHEISEEERRRIYNEMRKATKENMAKVKQGDNGNEIENAIEDNEPKRPQYNDERIAKHEISEEDRRRAYQEMRRATKENRARVQQSDNGSEVRSAIEDKEPPKMQFKDERIAKHEISEEDRRRAYQEMRRATKENKARVQQSDNGSEVRSAIEDKEPPNMQFKDERIAKHEISEEDRRRAYQEMRRATKENKARVQQSDNGGDVRNALEDKESPMMQYKDERIAKHEISEEDRRRAYQEMRRATKENRAKAQQLENAFGAQNDDQDNELPKMKIEDDRISKHDISPEDRRKAFEELRRQAQLNRNRHLGIEMNGGDARAAMGVEPAPSHRPQDDQQSIAKHEIPQDERYKLWREQRNKFKQYRNRQNNIRFGDEEPEENKRYPDERHSSDEQPRHKPIVDIKKEAKSNDSNDEDQKRNELYEIQRQQRREARLNKERQQRAMQGQDAKAALLGIDFEDEEENIPSWARDPTPKPKKIIVPPQPADFVYQNYDDEDVDDPQEVKYVSRPIHTKIADEEREQYFGINKEDQPKPVGTPRLLPKNIEFDTVETDDNDSVQLPVNNNIEPTGKPRPRILPSTEAQQHGLDEIQEMALSLKEAIDIRDNDKPNDFEDQEVEKSKFYYNGSEIKFPVVTDNDSRSYRSEAIRAFLERQIGAEKLIALNHEIISKAEGDPTPTPVYDDTPQVLIVLAQQLMILDAAIDDAHNKNMS